MINVRFMHSKPPRTCGSVKARFSFLLFYKVMLYNFASTAGPIHLHQPAQENGANDMFTLTQSAPSDRLATGTITACASHATPSLRIVNAAAAEIYKRWLPHVGEAEARAESERFARRFHILVDGPLAPLPADAELDAVAEALR